MKPDPLANMDPDVALGIRMWAHYETTLRMTGDARIAYSTLGFAVRAHASALEAASGKAEPFTAADWTLDNCPPFTEPAPAQPACGPKPWPGWETKIGGKPLFMQTFDPAPRGGGDEGLEEAHTLRRAYWSDKPPVLGFNDSSEMEAWLRVARAARSLRAKGGVTEAYRALVRSIQYWPGIIEAWGAELRAAQAEIAALDSGASVVVDREEWEALRVKAKPKVTLEEFDGLVRMRDERDSLAAKLAEARAMVGRAQEACDEARADAERLKGERDEAVEEVERYEEAIDESLPHYRDDEDDEANHIERVECAGKELKVANARLRTLPATVSVTRIEEAAAEIAHEATNVFVHNGRQIGKTQALAILRKHTATADVEGVAKAIHESNGSPIAWADVRDDARAMYRNEARAALAYLGVEAKPAEPRAGFSVHPADAWRVFSDSEGSNVQRMQSVLRWYETERAEWQKGGAS